MADLKPKAPEKIEDNKAPEKKTEEGVKTPIEAAALNNGVSVKIEGEWTEVRLSQYLAEHIGYFRSCSYVSLRFKNGCAPEIISIHEQGQ